MPVTSSKTESVSLGISEKSSLLKTKNDPNFSSQWPQHMAALTGSLIALSSGCVAGWSAPAIPHLQGNLGSLPISPLTSQQASWVGSIHTLGALFGSLPAGELAGIFGRKLLMLFLALPLIIGWSIILCGYENVYLIYLGRFITGLSFGAMAVVVPMYNNEIAEDNIRGVMGVYFDVMWCGGVLYAYVMGAYFSFFWFTLSCGLVPIVFVSAFIFMPETPLYFLMKGKPEDAEESVRWLRRGKTRNESTAIEMKKLQELLYEIENRQRGQTLSSKLSQPGSLRTILQSTQCIAMLIGIGLMTLQKLSGISAVVYYTVDIFREADTDIAPEMGTIIVGAVCLITTGSSAIFVDRIGRKVLLVTSGAMMSISLAVMALYTLFKSEGNFLANLNWIPIIAISGYVGFFGIGFGPIPWFMIDELLPKDTKHWANSSIICYNWFLTFLVAKSFGPLAEFMGFPIMYAMYSLICAISIFFIEFYVPETTNRSFLEINKEIALLFNIKNEKSYDSIKGSDDLEKCTQ